MKRPDGQDAFCLKQMVANLCLNCVWTCKRNLSWAHWLILETEWIIMARELMFLQPDFVEKAALKSLVWEVNTMSCQSVCRWISQMGPLPSLRAVKVCVIMHHYIVSAVPLDLIYPNSNNQSDQSRSASTATSNLQVLPPYSRFLNSAEEFSLKCLRPATPGLCNSCRK